MTNVEYFEMVEREVCGCMPEDKNTKYMKSIARSLAVIADGLTPREETRENCHIKSCSNCKYFDKFGSEEPCYSCIKSSDTTSNTKYWEPWEPKEDPEGTYWQVEKFGISCCSCGSYVALKYDASSDSIKPEDAYCPHCGKKWKGEKK